MLLVNQTKNFVSIITRYRDILLVLLFVLIFFITRVPRLHNDIVNPDGVNWHDRSQQFVNGLKYRQFEKTYPHYHPGVTLVWVTGIPNELFRYFNNIDGYNSDNFQAFDFVAKYCLIVFQLLISLIIIYHLAKLLGFLKAFFVVLLLSLEPYFLGNSRLYHLDVLLTLLLFLGLIFTFISVKTKSLKYALFSGVTIALAFLTKSLALGGILFFVALNLFMLARSRDFKTYIRLILVGTITFLITVFALFPALWVDPVHYLTFLFSESARVGLRAGHQAIVLGEETVSADARYYFLVMLIRLSPFIVLGLMLFMLNIKKILTKSYKDVLISFAVFYLTYLIAMSIPSKKIDRYILVIYPFLSLFAVVGFAEFAKLTRISASVKYVLLTLCASIFIGLPLIKYFPYYFTYSSPTLGNSTNANYIIAFKPFGVGVYDLKNFIFAKYGPNQKLGFLDVKPMEAIYANSKVFDIRVASVDSYDLIVLGINEKIPNNVLRSTKAKFYHATSLYLNGLEYWRIYAKQ